MPLQTPIARLFVSPPDPKTTLFSTTAHSLGKALSLPLTPLVEGCQLRHCTAAGGDEHPGQEHPTRLSHWEPKGKHRVAHEVLAASSDQSPPSPFSAEHMVNCNEVAEVRILVSEATILSLCMEQGTFITPPPQTNCSGILKLPLWAQAKESYKVCVCVF